jgi:molybdopterin-dependent oxidoreductase alpha subunit
MQVKAIEQNQAHRYGDIFRILWENRTELPYAWAILNHGVCDVCSLGRYGFRDSVVDGVHLCMRRLKSLKLNTMAPLDLGATADLNRLRRFGPQQLQSLGRLAHPMIRRRREPGFVRCSWDEGIEFVCRAVHDTAPHAMGFVATPHGRTNEIYYAFQKLARILGSNNVALSSYPSRDHALSGLKRTLGYGAPTCSLSDWIGTELLIIFGADELTNYSLTKKYLRRARKAGTRIIAVTPLARAKAESDWTSSLGRARMHGRISTPYRLQLRAGGEIAFINGVLKTLIANDQIDLEFIDKHTACFDSLREALQTQSWKMLERCSGVSRSEMQEFAIQYGAARSAVFVYTGGFTDCEFATASVTAIVNLALARGMLGREKCGIIRIGAQSSAQAGGECGVEPDQFPGGFFINENSARRLSNLWRHPVPSNPGLNLPAMIDAAYAHQIEFFYFLGGDPLETSPDDSYAAEALSRVPVRIYQDLVLKPSMLLETSDAVVVLPAQTRYEQRTGGTCTSTERRIRFTPELAGHKIGESRPEWEILSSIGRKSMPNGELLFPFHNSQTIREEMSRVMPIYQGIDKITKEGDQLQWGGPQLYREGFKMMPGNRALFTVLEPPADNPSDT